MTIIKEGYVSTGLDTSAYFATKKDIVMALRQGTIAEIDATNMYEKIVEGIKFLIKNNGDNVGVKENIELYNKIIDQIQEIADEEKKHVGEFQKLIGALDKNEIKLYKDGSNE